MKADADTIDQESREERGAQPSASTERGVPARSLGFLWIYAGIAGSLLLRLSVLDFESGDYRAFLGRWYDYFVEHGRLAAFKDDFTRYPVLYLYVVSVSTLLPIPKLYAIKLFSILCDYLAAWYGYRILRHRFPGGPLPWAGALGLLYLPTVWLNSAAWGQCDVMYATGLLATLYYLMVRRPLAAMVALGLACALKPQAIYFAPLLGGWFFRERMPWRFVAVPPLVYAVCGVPAMLGGKPVWDVLFRWSQHRNIPELTLGTPNWYQWVSNEYYQIFFMPGVVLAMVATVFLILAMQEKPREGTGDVAAYARWFVTAALLSVLMVPYFLPGMHERYFYAADLISLIYAFFVPRGWIVAVLVQFCSFFAYLPYLFKLEPVPLPLLALVMTGVLVWVATVFVKSVFKPPGAGQGEKGNQ